MGEKYRVKLSHCKNPDLKTGYWDGKPEGKASRLAIAHSIDHASRIVRHYLDNNGLGGGNWNGGQVQEFINGEWTYIGYIAYNGRFFDSSHA